MNKDVPDWAIERARELYRANVPEIPEPKYDGFSYQEAFARYITEHEEPPADPLLLEARAICASVAENKAYQYLDGTRDKYGDMEIALTALKRGIEMGEAK